MTSEQWNRVKSHFGAALEQDGSARNDLLERLNLEDAVVEKEVRRLLEENDRARDSFLSEPWPPSEAVPLKATFSQDDLISGRYRIVRYLAKGGMGEVYEATDLELGESVALKTLLAERSRHPDYLVRFKREIQLARRVSAPQICKIHDLGKHHDPVRGDILYLTMEFLRGDTLSTYLARKGRFSTAEALPLVRQMIQGLATAHRLDIIHRDFKSSNVMLVMEGAKLCAKITDFGLARTIEHDNGNPLTHPGQVVGTPAYMAPEQFAGESSPATDIFALGVVMHEMVTGVRPFDAKLPPDKRPRPSPTALVPGLDPKWESAIVRCLHPQPGLRFGKIEDVATALGGGDQSEVSTIDLSTSINPRRFQWKLAIPLLLALILTGVFWSSYQRLPEQKHIAVLRFGNLTKNVTDDAFCEGLVESLASDLSQLGRNQKSFWVAPAIESREARSPEDAYQKLGATLVVTGSFERLPDRAELFVNLVDARTHRQLDSRRIPTPPGDISKLEADAWQSVVDMLSLQVDSQAVRALQAGKAKASGAYEYYVQGLGYLRRDGLANWDVAAGLFEKAVSIDRSYAPAYAGLGLAYALKFEGTKDPRWMKLAQGYGSQAARLGEGEAPVHQTAGEIARITGQREQARRELELALKLDPGLIEAYFSLANLYGDEGDFKEAERLFRVAVDRRPGYWRTHSELGTLLFNHSKYEGAESEFKEAKTLQPDDPQQSSNLGAVYMVTGRLDLAVKEFRLALARSPKSDAYSNLGTCLVWLKRFDEAAAAMRKAVEINPTNYENWRNLADAYDLIPGKKTEAIAAYQRALELAEPLAAINPKNGDVLSSIALYQAHLNRRNDALRSIERASKLSPANPDVLFTRALVYEILSQRSAAQRALEAAYAAGHSLEDIKREPVLESLRTDKLFLTWLKKIEGQKAQK